MKLSIIAAGATTLFLACAAAYVYCAPLRLFIFNFHEVIPHRFYRSAQLPPLDMERVIEENDIKVVVALLADSPESSQILEEKRIVEDAGAKFVQVDMASESIPSRHSLLKLLEIYQKFKNKAILVHCRSGADRTGLASALYLKEIMNVPKSEAARMLSPKYRHVSTFVPAKLWFWNLYDGITWAKFKYFPCTENLTFADHGNCGGEEFLLYPGKGYAHFPTFKDLESIR